mgnify:CR=1 FL=1
MRNIIDNWLLNIILLFTIIGEFFIPWVLERFYAEYNGKIMVMSALGNPQSPIRLIYNLWLIWLGGFLTFTAIVYFLSIRVRFPVLAVFVLLSIGIFAIGAGLISGFFSVNESKNIVTAASKIHGISAAVGFVIFLFFPLLNGILAFKQNDFIFGVVSIISFILALVFFICFIMGDKEQFQNTMLKYEGIWERLTLLCMYIPFIYRAVHNLLS